MRRLVAAVAFLALVPAAAASHPARFISVRVNLDGDRARERLLAEENVSFNHTVWYSYVNVIDVCRGQTRTHAVTRRWRELDVARAVQADGRGRLEVFAVVRRSFDAGEAKLVRLQDRRGACPALRVLFAFATDRIADPPAALTLRAFEVALAELDAARGLEVRVLETYGLPAMLSSRQRETRYRYERAGDRYAAYSSEWRVVP